MYIEVKIENNFVIISHLSMLLSMTYKDSRFVLSIKRKTRLKQECLFSMQ